MQHAGGMVAVYFEAAAVITTLVLLGQVLERARSRTGDAIGCCSDWPRIWHVLRADGTEEDIPRDQVVPGDRLASGRVKRCRSTVS